MGARGRRGAEVVLAALAFLAAGCSSGTPGAEKPATSESAPESAPEPAPDATTALRERCLSAMPEEAPLEAVALTGATGGDVEAARIGPAHHAQVAVLLPQVGGVCGWGRWATAAFEEAGLTSLLVNPCGYGESTCTAAEDGDPLNEVSAAVELAREDYGARRVVLLGTSMGGSLTVIAVANGADVDGWADISGPPEWDGVTLAPLARRVRGTGLVAIAPTDGQQAFDAAESLARAADVPFVAGRSGHGWDLLVDPIKGSMTRIGRRVLAHALGPDGS